MTAPIIAFFNNKGGVGKTSLCYHLAWMYAEQGRRVLAVDLDPQANLTAAFVTDEAIETIWPENGVGPTVYGSVSPLLRGVGDIAPTPLVHVADRLALLPGDLGLSRFEDELSQQWPDCLDGKERAFRVISAFWRLIATASEQHRADVILVDVGPNLGALNRSALVAADYVLIPLAPDLFSVQGLRNLGPTLRRWRGEWRERLDRSPDPSLALPSGDMRPIGYVLLQHSVRLGSPVNAYRRWMTRIPGVFAVDVLDVPAPVTNEVDDDPYCLAQLKHYRSLMPMAQEAHKPVFALRPADGAFGGHQQAVQRARADFVGLMRAVEARTQAPATAV